MFSNAKRSRNAYISTKPKNASMQNQQDGHEKDESRPKENTLFLIPLLG